MDHYAIRMKPLVPFRMSPGLCGPAALKILLSYYKREHSEEELTHLCEATPDADTSHGQIVTGLKALGGNPVTKDGAMTDDMRRMVEDQHPVLVGWQLAGKNHYSVVYEVSKTRIFMMDPITESGIRIMSIEEFEKLWLDTDPATKQPVRGWMLTLPNWVAKDS